MQIVIWVKEDCSKCKMLVRTLSDPEVLTLAEVVLANYDTTTRPEKSKVKSAGMATLQNGSSILGVITADTSTSSVIEYLKNYGM